MMDPLVTGLLAVLALVVAWAGWEISRLRRDLEPILSSSIAQGLAAL